MHLFISSVSLSPGTHISTPLVLDVFNTPCPARRLFAYMQCKFMPKYSVIKWDMQGPLIIPSINNNLRLSLSPVFAAALHLVDSVPASPWCLQVLTELSHFQKALRATSLSPALIAPRSSPYPSSPLPSSPFRRLLAHNEERGAPPSREPFPLRGLETLSLSKDLEISKGLVLAVCFPWSLCELP